MLGFSWQGVWDFRGHEPVHWLQLSTYPYRSPYYFIRLTKIKEIPLELKVNKILLRTLCDVRKSNTVELRLISITLMDN